MRNLIQKSLSLLTLLFITVYPLFSQQQPVEMADGMRSNGKIYVVVAVLGVIFIGLLLFLISIDRKVSRLEKENKKQ